MKNNCNTFKRKTSDFKVALCLSFFVLFSIQSFATVLTVDNNYPQIGQFATIQEAHDAASAGDTIYVSPSNVPYSGITITKRLTLIGCGFYKTDPNSIKTAIINSNLILDAGSDGSTIESFQFQFVEPSITVGITINVSGVTIMRNKLMKILLNSNHTGTIIENNFVEDITTANYPFGAIQIENNNTIIIQNNLIIRKSNNGTNTGIGIRLFGSNISGVIKNNTIIVGVFSHPENISIDLSTSNCTAYNNVMILGTCLGNQFSYNICDGNQLPADNGNIPGAIINDLFVNFDGGDYHLKTDSKAMTGGLDKEQMGIYGGEPPFIDGGYPDIPSIYYLDVPLIGTQKDGLNVTIKAKSNQ